MKAANNRLFLCSGRTVCRDAMTLQGCNLLENAGRNSPDGKERVCSGRTVCRVGFLGLIIYILIFEKKSCQKFLIFVPALRCYQHL